MITTRPDLTGSFGMVASTHWLATASGMSVLERGGNAFDAAVATGFVLQIVEPHLNGPGGDVPAIVWPAGDDAPVVVCGQGVAPAGATIDAFADLGLSLVPGTGLLAATVPGAFGAWTLMLERWGTWELADVLAYALHYAEDGFPLLPAISATIAAVEPLFREHWSPSAATWLTSAGAPQPGVTWRSPVVASTYRRILDAAVGPTRETRIAAARDAFYRGFVAETIERFALTAWRDTSGRDHAGLLTADDCARWAPSVEAPISVDYAGRYEVFKTGPWGQGPVLLQQLRLLEQIGIGTFDVRSAQWVHLIVEAAKLAFADREAFYGDTDDVPLQALLSREYAQERGQLVGPSASMALRPGSPDGRAPRLATLPDPTRTTSGVGEPTRGDTCHLDVVDRWGNLVSVTPSGGWLQSSPVIPGLGFPLGTRAQMFFCEPGLPNSLRPGARPRTTLSPSMAARDGEPWLSFGTPGGDQQDQWQLTFFLDLVHGGASLQQAIDAPSWHTNHMPSSFYPRIAVPGQVEIEDRIGTDVLDELRRRGHQIVPAGDWSLGRLSAVSREAGVLRAAANPRGAQGYAAGR